MEKQDKCPACELPSISCICAAVDEFFKDNRHLMDDLAKQEKLDSSVGAPKRPQDDN